MTAIANHSAPDDGDYIHPLTRKAEVFAFLKAGGWVEGADQADGSGVGLLKLFAADGTEVPAWQNAIRSNLAPSLCQVDVAGIQRVWRLRQP